MADTKAQNQNCKKFEQFLARNTNISVVNALPLCEGIFTRVVSTRAVTCGTILDFFVVCDKILPHVTKMKIDENGEHALIKYRTGIVKTDHNMLSLEVNLIFHNEIKHERVEVFNLKNKTCQQNFKEFTSKTDILSKCFMTNETVEIQFDKWKKKF